jgi:hypothetical protein
MTGAVELVQIKTSILSLVQREVRIFGTTCLAQFKNASNK